MARASTVVTAGRVRDQQLEGGPRAAEVLAFLTQTTGGKTVSWDDAIQARPLVEKEIIGELWRPFVAAGIALFFVSLFLQAKRWRVYAD